MKHLILERFCYSPQGTFGRLLNWYTIELPWQYNERNVSCVPQGTWLAKRFHSVKHPNTFELSIPARTGILFHVGNTKDDFQGCIGLGKSLGVVNSKWAIQESGKAFAEFMEYLKDDQEFRLTITQYKP
jgi:hypothetical protein